MRILMFAIVMIFIVGVLLIMEASGALKKLE